MIMTPMEKKCSLLDWFHFLNIFTPPWVIFLQVRLNKLFFQYKNSFVYIFIGKNTALDNALLLILLSFLISFRFR